LKTQADAFKQFKILRSTSLSAFNKSPQNFRLNGFEMSYEKFKKSEEEEDVS